MTSQATPSPKLSWIAIQFNRLIGFLVGRGMGLAHMYLLEVRGRKSGKLYTTPVDLLILGSKKYLVAPRGYTQWVRNAEAAGEINLRKGSKVMEYRLRALSKEERPPILKEYLDQFKNEVKSFFPVPAGSPVEMFIPIAESYPAFELITK